MNFDETASLGYETPAQIAAYLRAIDDADTALRFERGGIAGQSLMGFNTKYSITGHRFGFISPDRPSVIDAISNVEPDQSLIGTAIKVTLDKFYVEEYPGLGRHTILLQAFGRNQAGAETEELRFTTVVEARDRDGAGVAGLPLFTGLNVPPDGLAFKATTASLRSSGDAIIIEALKSGTFQNGLKLLGLVQPALPQLVSLAAGVTGQILDRRHNKQIQGFQLGLDFSGNATACALRCGSYVVAQVPDDGTWDWADWRFDVQAQCIRSRFDDSLAPYNSMIFGISRSAAEEPHAAALGLRHTEMAASDKKGGVAKRMPAKPAATRRTSSKAI